MTATLLQSTTWFLLMQVWPLNTRLIRRTRLKITSFGTSSRPLKALSAQLTLIQSHVQTIAAFCSLQDSQVFVTQPLFTTKVPLID